MTQTYDAIDCQAFAGGFTLGTVRAGFRLVGKREQVGGFGVAPCEANRELLGYDWEAEACPPEEWSAKDVPYVFGNPPCSGFSLLSRKDFRGVDSPINSCMWAFVRYAVRCNPQIMVFESVGQAYKQGRPLMTGLRAEIERLTGEQWDLTHVLHNNYSLGGAAVRRRYFFVAHKIPFSVEPYPLRRVPVLMDVIGDLQGLGRSWEPQVYRRPPTWWTRGRRSEHGVVDGHWNIQTPGVMRAFDLLETGLEWREKESVSKVARRYYEETGGLPESWHHLGSYPKLMEQAPDFRMGFNQMSRWAGGRAARVVTGAGLATIVHPTEDRTITHREAVRIQGFPDDWRLSGLRGASGLQLMWGKGIPVDCGEWISSWVKAALDGTPGEMAREPDGDREYRLDVTEDYRQFSNER